MADFESALSELGAVLAATDALQPSVEAISPNVAHVLRAGIAYREATVRWLDSLPSATEHHAASTDTPRPPEDAGT